jgi:hypothetical protein
MDEPPPPETYMIPNSAIDKWVGIPRDRDIIIHINRGDFDNLFFAIKNLQHTVGLLRVGMKYLLQKESDTANSVLDQSLGLLVNSSDDLSRMMQAVMERAEELPK